MLKSLGIKSILILMLVFATLSGVAVVGLLGYFTGARALDEAIFQQLTSVRASKAQQIESYFTGIRSQVETLAEDPTLVRTLSEFREGFRQLPDRPLTDVWLQQLRQYYADTLLPSLREDGGTPTPENYFPVAAAGRFLQYRYIAANPNPIGEKQKMMRADDGTAYDTVHARFHGFMRRLVEKFGYYDLFLVDLDGNVVYTVYKEPDFATNLERGPYRYSRLAEVFRAVRAANHPGFVKMVDFGSYVPSHGQPAAFIASPIFDGTRAAGALILQISVDEINKITTGGGRWAEEGLGKTGETYLVGADNRMRSVSRFLQEDKERYLEALRKTDLNTEIIDRIERAGTSILEQPVPDNYFSGHSGSRHEGLDYRGVRVLSTWQSLNIGDVQWRILAEMDLAEARAPIRQFGSRVLVVSSAIAIVITLIAMGLAALFVRPIRSLIDGTRRIAAGESDVSIDVGSQAEFSDLARSFNSMVDSLRAETQRAEEASRRQEGLLLRMLPQPVLDRLREGEKDVAETYENVTVLVAEIAGLATLAKTRPATELIELTNALIAGFDDATEAFGVEKFNTRGNTFIAVSGFSAPRLDHARCAIDFGLEMFAIVKRFNRNSRASLGLRIGIDSGMVVAGIVGERKLNYDILGGAVTVADRLRSRAEPGSILVSREVRERVGEIYSFEPAIEISVESGGAITASVLRPRGATATVAEP